MTPQHVQLHRLLVLVSPMMRGPDVVQVQRDLRRHHGTPGPIDGVYGPATVHAVRVFQRSHRLEPDGVVGPHTWAALVDRKAAAPGPAAPPAAERLGEAAVEWMIRHVDIGEHPPGSNHNVITEEFKLGDVAWCAETVSLAFKHAEGVVLGKSLADRGHPPAGYWPGRGFAFVPYLEAWAKLCGFWLGRSAPIRGDVIFYQWPGTREADHVGMVTGSLASSTVPTVEGNTSDNLLTQRRSWDASVLGIARIRAHTPQGVSIR